MLIFMAHQLGHKVTPTTASAASRRSIYRYAAALLVSLAGLLGGLIGRAT